MNKFRLPDAFLLALKAVNVDPPFLFRKSDLPPTLCSSGDGMISTEQNFRLWHTLREISDDPAIGLRVAILNLHHPPNMAAQHARTFGDALLDLARSRILSFSEHMRIIKTKNECSIEFTGAMLNEAAPALFLDTALMLETGTRHWALAGQLPCLTMKTPTPFSARSGCGKGLHPPNGERWKGGECRKRQERSFALQPAPLPEI